jgi:hypothetical protein
MNAIRNPSQPTFAVKGLLHGIERTITDEKRVLPEHRPVAFLPNHRHDDRKDEKRYPVGKEKNSIRTIVAVDPVAAGKRQEANSRSTTQL